MDTKPHAMIFNESKVLSLKIIAKYILSPAHSSDCSWENTKQGLNRYTLVL